jgi:hypothetical protein
MFQYLESYPASALIHVDAFPPYPAECAERALDNMADDGLSVEVEDLLHELLDPANDVFLEPMSVRMLMLGTSALESDRCAHQLFTRGIIRMSPPATIFLLPSSFVTAAHLHASAAFHGVEQADLVLLSDASPAFLPGATEVDAVLADHVYEWVDVYF